MEFEVIGSSPPPEKLISGDKKLLQTIQPSFSLYKTLKHNDKIDTMKNALIICNSLGFINFLFGNIEQLQNLGYSVTVACNCGPEDQDSSFKKKVRHLGVSLKQIDFQLQGNKLKNSFNLYFEIRRLIYRNNYSFIHCHTSIPGFLTRMVAKKWRKNGGVLLYTAHGFPFNRYTSSKKRFLFYHCERLASRYCDAEIVMNEENFQSALKMHCKNVYLIPGVGIDIRKYHDCKVNIEEKRQSLGINKDDIMVHSVGLLTQRKNHRVVIEAISLLPNKNRFIYVISGDGNYEKDTKDQLIALAREKGVRLLLLGQRKDVNEINKCCQIFVLPSLIEGLCLSGVEALASGCLVVGSSIPGIEDYIIDGVTGYLANPKKPSSFCEQFQNILSMGNAQKASMREAAYNLSLKYSQEVAYSNMDLIYKRFLK